MERYSSVVSGSGIYCKNGCGYYGNPSWNNYCSKCYREFQLKNDSYARKARALSSTSSRAFANFEAKRKKVARKSSGTIKNILKLQRGRSQPGSNISEEGLQARDEFYRVLKTWRSGAEHDVEKQIDKLLKDLESSELLDIEKISNMFRDFYELMSKRIFTDSIYQDSSASQKEILMNAIEKFLTVWIYPWAFAPANTDDEEVDIKLQDRIRSLHWVSHKHLDAPIDPSSKEQSRHLEIAILNLIRQNEVQPTEAKLDQIVNCCREVYEALRLNAEANASSASTTTAAPTAAAGGGRPTSTAAAKQAQVNADDLLPALIWVVLRANPPFLHSNLQFIMRFASSHRLETGEAACCFTHLCCAVEYIKKVTPKSLGMSKEEFDRQMLEGVPVTLCPPSEASSTDALSEARQRYSTISQKLDDVESRIAAAESELASAEQRTAERAAQIRSSCSLKSTVYLDPRELVTPHILCLGPPPRPPPRPVDNVIDQLAPDAAVAAAPCLAPTQTPSQAPPRPPPRQKRTE